MLTHYSQAGRPVVFQSCGMLRSQNDFTHHRRQLDLDVLILVTEGTLHISQIGEKYSVSKNKFIHLPAHTEHYGFAASQGLLSYYWVHFYFHKPSEIDGLMHRPGNLRNVPESNPYIIPIYGEMTFSHKAHLLFSQLLALSIHPKAYSEYMLNYTTSLLLLEITQDYVDAIHRQENKIPKVISEICEWINLHYDQDITLKYIAKNFGYHPDYLSVLFKRCMNQTFNHYVHTVRIHIAKNLLSSNKVSIKEAAFSCGFKDEKYFMRIFKREVGVTPSEFKNTNSLP